MSTIMKNKIENINNRIDQIDEIIQRLKTVARLSAEDKKIFATNLGQIACRLDSNNPRSGAKKIVDQSGQEGIWAKRKRFFRLPGEDTPEIGKEGEYASNPTTFISLAEAAAKLLCKSSQNDAIEREQRAVIKTLVRGSSFMPNFVPSNTAEISATSLLNDYSQALSTAIENRTRITELWKILETTGIEIETPFPEEKFKDDISSFGDASVVPSEIVNDLYKSNIKHARFRPSEHHNFKNDGWAFPSLKIGYVATKHKIKIFSIPENKSSLFTKGNREMAGALVSLGFENMKFTDSGEDFPFMT